MFQSILCMVFLGAVLSNATGSQAREESGADRALLQVLGFGHVDGVRFSPLGTKLIVQHGGVVSLFDAAAGTPMPGFDQGPLGISLLDFSPDELRLVSVRSWEQAHEAVIWDVAQGSELFRLDHGDAITAVAWSPAGQQILTEGGDGIIKLWYATNGELQHVLESRDVDVLDMATYSSDGKKVRTRGYQGSRGRLPAYHPIAHKIWNATTGEKLVSLAHTGTMALSPDFRWALTPDPVKANEALLWDVKSGMQVRRIPFPTGRRFTALALLPDGETFLAATRLDQESYESDDRVELWDSSTAEHLRTLGEGTGAVFDAKISPDGKFVVLSSSGEDPYSYRHLWDLTTGTPMDGEDVPFFLYAAVSPDGTLGAMRRRRNNFEPQPFLEVFEIPGERLYTLSGNRRCLVIQGASFSPSGAAVMLLHQGEGVALWDPKSGQERSFLEDNREQHTRFSAFVSDDRILTSRNDGTFTWNIDSGESVDAFGEAFSIAIGDSGSNALLSWWTRDAFDTPDRLGRLRRARLGTADLWDTSTGIHLQNFSVPEESFSQLAISPDASRAATGAVNGVVRLWDVESGELLKVLKRGMPRYNIQHLAFSPDGRLLLAGISGYSIEVWEAHSGERLFRAPLENEHIVTFSTDSKKILTSGTSSSTALWDAETGEELAVLKGHGPHVRGAVFSPGGATLLVWNSDSITVWDANSAKLLYGASALLPGPLTAAAFSPDGKELLLGTRAGRGFLLSLEALMAAEDS